MQASYKFSSYKYDSIAFYTIGLSVFEFVSLQVIAEDILT